MSYTITVDPGLRNWAWVLFDSNGRIVSTRSLKMDSKKSQEVRLLEIFLDFSENRISSGLVIDVIVFEKQFMNTMIQITGVIKAACAALSASPVLYEPSSWKKKATGKGNISEEDLKDYIISRYPEAKDFDEHQIDAVGMYLAYKSSESDNAKGSKKAKKREKVRTRNA